MERLWYPYGATMIDTHAPYMERLWCTHMERLWLIPIAHIWGDYDWYTLPIYGATMIPIWSVDIQRLKTAKNSSTRASMGGQLCPQLGWGGTSKCKQYCWYDLNQNFWYECKQYCLYVDENNDDDNSQETHLSQAQSKYQPPFNTFPLIRRPLQTKIIMVITMVILVITMVIL